MSKELVRNLQPGPETDLVTLFGDEAASAKALEALSPFFEEEVEVIGPTQVADRDRYVGLAGLRAGWLDWLRPWESYRVEVEEILDAGDDAVVLVRDYGRHPEMTAEVSVAGAAIWTVRDRKVVRVAFYLDRADGLAAAGLSE